MPTQEVISLVDKAATASDRWLIVVLVSILGGIGYFALRYLANQLAAAQTELKELNKLILSEKQICTAALTQSTEALEASTRALEKLIKT